MTSERAQAYGRVMKAIEMLAATKLHPDEQQLIRGAADSLFFCEDLGGDPAARQALYAFQRAINRLVESERVLPETAGRLAADVESCGPLVPVR
jgi:hypothetical protein